MQIPGQIGLFEFLAEKQESLPADTVSIEGIINTKTMSDFTVRSTYKDIFLIINMLDDYVSMLTQPGRDSNFHTDYMVGQFERISMDLSEQICLDKEKMYKRCQKRKEQKNDIGEDAMVLASKGKAGNNE